MFQSAVMRPWDQNTSRNATTRRCVSIRCHAAMGSEPSGFCGTTHCRGFNPLSCGHGIRTLSWSLLHCRRFQSAVMRPWDQNLSYRRRSTVCKSFNPLSCGHGIRTAALQPIHYDSKFCRLRNLTMAKTPHLPRAIPIPTIFIVIPSIYHPSAPKFDVSKPSTTVNRLS